MATVLLHTLHAAIVVVGAHRGPRAGPPRARSASCRASCAARPRRGTLVEQRASARPGRARERRRAGPLDAGADRRRDRDAGRSRRACSGRTGALPRRVAVRTVLRGVVGRLRSCSPAVLVRRPSRGGRRGRRGAECRHGRAVGADPHGRVAVRTGGGRAGRPGRHGGQRRRGRHRDRRVAGGSRAPWREPSQRRTVRVTALVTAS